MRGITDISGSTIRAAVAPGAPGGSRVEPQKQSGTDSSPRSSGAGDVGRFGALGRLWEERGTRWADALQTRQTERRLAKVAERVDDSRVRLEQLKLYPPYPIDEPRRAQAIRQFNGIAEEVRRLATAQTSRIPLPDLTENASTEAVESVVRTLERVGAALVGERAALREGRPTSHDVDTAQAESAEVGAALGEVQVNLAPASGELLRQLA